MYLETHKRSVLERSLKKVKVKVNTKMVVRETSRLEGWTHALTFVINL